MTDEVEHGRVRATADTDKREYIFRLSDGNGKKVRLPMDLINDVKAVVDELAEQDVRKILDTLTDGDKVLINGRYMVNMSGYDTFSGDPITKEIHGYGPLSIQYFDNGRTVVYDNEREKIMDNIETTVVNPFA